MHELSTKFVHVQETERDPEKLSHIYGGRDSVEQPRQHKTVMKHQRTTERPSSHRPLLSSRSSSLLLLVFSFFLLLLFSPFVAAQNVTHLFTLNLIWSSAVRMVVSRVVQLIMFASALIQNWWSINSMGSIKYARI